MGLTVENYLVQKVNSTKVTEVSCTAFYNGIIQFSFWKFTFEFPNNTSNKMKCGKKEIIAHMTSSFYILTVLRNYSSINMEAPYLSETILRSLELIVRALVTNHLTIRLYTLCIYLTNNNSTFQSNVLQ